MRTTCLYVTITDSTFDFGDIGPGQSVNNQSDPFDLSVQSSCPPGTIAQFELVTAAAETTWTHIFVKPIGIAPGSVIWGPKPVADFPTTGFIYGVAYDRNSDCLYLCDAWGRMIYRCSADSLVAALGSIPAPDTNLADIAYSFDDDKVYVTSFYLKQVWKLEPATGAVLRQFVNPANDYPVGLTMLSSGTVWYADRRTALGGTQLIYVGDTLGTAVQYPSPVQGYYNSRCLARDTLGSTVLQVQTWFNSTGSAIDSVGVVEISGIPPVLTGRRFKLNPVWNIRGIEFDPRDGDYWITIPQGAGPVNQLVKVRGFYDPAQSVAEQSPAAGPLPFAVNVLPNPARGRVSFTVSSDTRVTAEKVFDINGRLIRSLKPSAIQSWDGSDARGNRVPDGVYFLLVETESGRQARKFVIAR